MRTEAAIREYFAAMQERSRSLNREQALKRLRGPSSRERLEALEAWMETCLVLGTLQWVLGETEARYPADVVPASAASTSPTVRSTQWCTDGGRHEWVEEPQAFGRFARSYCRTCGQVQEG